jgi:osmotically-inducible protein OsmY
MKYAKTAMLALIGTAGLLAGCSQRTINSANQDANHDISVVSHAADQAAKDARPQVQKAALGARVTTALVAANLHGIRVDAAPDGVTLVGHVASGAEKSRAMQIAQNTLGPGKTVHSRLTVTNGS